jgi:glycosyltransferase involved in cell wall biosynthesis
MSEQFTVVIPLYNKAPYIQRTINSVLNQTYKDYEIIVVDDGSTDGGGLLVEAIRDPRMRLICQNNAGVSAARNRGIKEAKGELIAFLDADDEWLPEFLEQIAQLKADFPGCGAYATSYQSYVQDKRSIDYINRTKLDKFYSKGWRGILNDYFKIARQIIPFNSSSVCLPRKVLCDLGGFNAEAHFGEDLDMWLRVALKFQIAYLYESYAIYHTEAENRACKINIHEDDIFFANTLENALKENSLSEVQRKNIYEYLVKSRLFVVSQLINNGDNQKAYSIVNLCQGTKSFFWNRLWWLFWSCLPAWCSLAAIRAKRLVNRKIFTFRGSNVYHLP